MKRLKNNEIIFIGMAYGDRQIGKVIEYRSKLYLLDAWNGYQVYCSGLPLQDIEHIYNMYLLTKKPVVYKENPEIFVYPEKHKRYIGSVIVENLQKGDI